MPAIQKITTFLWFRPRAEKVLDATFQLEGRNSSP